MSKELILIIDDEKAICDILSQMLDKSGFTTICFYNFTTAKPYYEKKHAYVDVVLMDLNLPDVNGEEAIVELKGINPDVKIIILSGYINGESQYGSNFGAKRLIQKPVNIIDLEKAVSDVLEE